ncbi:MAG: PH domain-containing protein [Candidatus Limnocylindria bacterium]
MATSRSSSHGIPRDVVLEPDEHVLVATRPLYLWEPQVVLIAIAALVAGYLWRDADLRVAGGALAVAATVYALLLLIRWIRWRSRWFVLTDRRVIARWGVFDRNQSALLLERIQDASLQRPFPLSLLRDYGVIRIESAGVHSEERISEGLRDLAMTGATRFYRALTDAQTPAR